MMSKTKAAAKKPVARTAAPAAQSAAQISPATLAYLQSRDKAATAAEAQLAKAHDRAEDLRQANDDLQEQINAARMTVLGQAEAIVGGARQTMYGHPKANFDCAAAMVSAYLTKRATTQIDAHDWAMINVLDKVARQANARADHNLIDIAGYARTAEMVDDAVAAAAR